MWKLEHITARNVCSFRELEYTPAQGVTTLIFGYNADNESQQSNGSGKSTLIEAIALGITGSPLRRVRTEEIINDTAESCYVQLHFGNDVLHEDLIIEREVFRKGSSNVCCTILCGEKSEQVSQSSVDAYNKFILDKLGITREELFSSFILSRHRYSDFLSTSDREKKEVINRFSNGAMVDQAIEQLHKDIDPISVALKDAELEYAGIEGRVEMLNEQIHQEEESLLEKQRTKEEKIISVQNTVAQKRILVRECQATVASCKNEADKIDALDKQLQKLEDSDESLDSCITQITPLLSSFIQKPLTDWTQILKTKKRDIELAEKEVEKWTVVLGQTSDKIAKAEKKFHDQQIEFDAFGREYEHKRKELTAEMEELQARFTAANNSVAGLKKQKIVLSGAIEELHAKLAGSVECPSCGHVFLVSDKAFDVAAAHLELNEKQLEIGKIDEGLKDGVKETEQVEMIQVTVRDEARDLIARKDQWEDRMSKARREVEAAQYEMEGYKFNMSRMQELLTARSREIARLREQVFEEAYDRIDMASKSNARALSDAQEQICAAKSSIDTLQETITELQKLSGAELIESLKSSLKMYRRKSSECLAGKCAVQKQLDALVQQEQVFIQFKSYLANTKIDALSSMMNCVLADLGSDLRVKLSGYTTLKTGMVREKISVSIIRDGVDAGSFGKFSEGEKARVNLASIVSMQRLVNGNCEVGKGVDMIVIDEVIDSMDADGLASVFSALNHLNVTALVVSHGAVAEGYKHRLLITKRNGESRIDG